VPGSHGFFRYFAFEGVLLLLVLNVPHWFRDPLSAQQVLSWVLLTASGVLVIAAVAQFRRIREPPTATVTGPEFAFERTARVVTTGAFRWIRHPMYASVLYLGWGAALKHVTPAALVAVLITTAAVVATALAEEREDLARFGETYRHYMERTKRFVPWIW